jgi:hypothetical protein
MKAKATLVPHTCPWKVTRTARSKSSAKVPDGAEGRGHGVIHPDVYLAELRFRPDASTWSYRLTSAGMGRARTPRADTSLAAASSRLGEPPWV